MKETINKTKRPPTAFGKIFANDTSDKELTSKIYKEFIQLNIKKKNPTPLKNNQKTQRDIFPKKYIWMANGYIRKMLNITNQQSNTNQNCNEMHPNVHCSNTENSQDIGK